MISTEMMHSQDFCISEDGKRNDLKINDMPTF